MSNLSDLAVLVDSGLVVLIWSVQLIIYPSFLYYEPKNLRDWHTAYTPRITVIVAPLMFGQLIYAGLVLFQTISFFSISYASLVLASWLLTFFIFIPIHYKIQNGNTDRLILSRLVNLNWIRTFVWSAILVLSLGNHLI